MEDGASVSAFISNLLEMKAADVSAEIRTIILNNKVVDEPDRSEMKAGSSLTLSGAMPGLVGAMLRSGSPYKAMRGTITSETGGSEQRSADSMARVKLLNTVLKNHRNAMIRRGFWIDDGGG